MRMIAYYSGRNRDFQDWLAAGMPANVISLAAYKNKKAAKGAAFKNIFGPSIA